MKKRKIPLWVYIGTLLIWAFSIGWIPWAGEIAQGGNRVSLLLNGIAFWAGAVICMGSIWWIYKRRRQELGAANSKKGWKQLALFQFCKNREAMVVDLLLLLTIIGIVVAAICIKNYYLLFALVATLVFLLGMHCMLNGSGYDYIMCRKGEKEL